MVPFSGTIPGWPLLQRGTQFQIGSYEWDYISYETISIEGILEWTLTGHFLLGSYELKMYKMLQKIKNNNTCYHTSNCLLIGTLLQVRCDMLYLYVCMCHLRSLFFVILNIFLLHIYGKVNVCFCNVFLFLMLLCMTWWLVFFLYRQKMNKDVVPVRIL